MPARTESAIQFVRAAVRAAGLGERTDAELLAAFLAGDAAAFEAIVRRHGPMVLRTCRAATRCDADADDAFQTTFVLLHRKAAAVRDRRSLAGWLFRVARRSAGNARRAADRRARREAANGRSTSQPPTDLSWREACDVLHAEIDRLPDAYRLPLVLCYLQGLARDEAARRLGWSLNEVRGRLERGRSWLRLRLQKRGITLSAGLLATVGANAVPPALIRSTVTAARTAGTVALPLSAGLWKAGVLSGLAAAVVVTFALQKDGAHAQPAEKPKAVAEVPKRAGPEVTKTVGISGIVVGTNGSGACSVKVIVRRQDQKDADGVSTTTDPGGRFSVVVPAIADGTPIVAVSVGNGTFAGGWLAWTGLPPAELRLVEARNDHPIRGRIIDLEGKPIAGVTVAVRAVHAFPDAKPQAFADWVAGRRPRPRQNTLHAAPPGATASVTTKADGKFEITGIGDDRVAVLHISGRGIVYETIDVATVAAIADPGGKRPDKVYAATFDHVSAPARLIRGVARDIDTGKPVAGLRINGFGGAVTVTTDRAGRYELPGYRKGPRYTVFGKPADGSAYFPTMAEAADTAGLDPLVIDLKVKAGVPVRGRLKDALTGKPVAGTVRYWPLAGNLAVSNVPVGQKPGEFYTVEVQTKPDGTFTVAALPDEGFLAVTADGWYQAARVDPVGYADKAGVISDTDYLSIAVGGAAITRLLQERYQAIRLLRIDPAKPPAEQAIELTPAEPIRGRFVDPEGKPLEGVRVRGLTMTGEPWSPPLAAAEFVASPPHPDRPRWLYFRHDGRKLIGFASVKAGSTKPVDFKLEPWAKLTGRVLDSDGRPIARATVVLAALEGAPLDGRRGTVLTDADGRFSFDGILPGMPYRVMPLSHQTLVGGKDAKVTLKPGEERNLGELKVPAPDR